MGKVSTVHTHIHIFIRTYIHTYVLEPGTDYVVKNATNMLGQLAPVTSVPQELNFPTTTRCLFGSQHHLHYTHDQHLVITM